MVNTADLLGSILDDEQKVVAGRTDGNVLVLAPPGSGKTRVLVGAAAHRVRDSRQLVGYDGARVLCLTFGNDAAREMRKRLEHRPLGIGRHQMWVGNYHGLAMHLLRRYGHHLGWPRDAALVPSPQNEALIAEAIRDVGVKGVTARDAAGAVSRLKSQRSIADGAAESLVAIRSRYDELLRLRHLRDFDDLILHAGQLLETVPALKQVLHDAYPFVFIDELQDTSLLQLDLLTHLAGKDSRVFAVADDDQMIYGWRDAHPENIDKFVERFSPHEVALKGNYRCPERVVAAANAVILGNDRRRDLLMESRVTSHPGEVVVTVASSVSQSTAVALAIEKAVSEGTPLGQIAVLAPHKFKFDDVLAVLRSRGISYVHPGGDEVSGSLIVGVLQLTLRCLAGGVVAANDLVPLAGVKDPEQAAKIVQSTALEASDGTPRGLLNRLLVAYRWGTVRTPERDVDTVRVLARMFRKAIDDERPSNSVELAAAVVQHWDRLEAAALRAEDAVKVMTSFTAKGTEYQVVILPFMNDGIVPYKRKGGEIDWQEARRVFYVALTRAERRVVLIRDDSRAASALLDIVQPHATLSETV